MAAPPASNQLHLSSNLSEPAPAASAASAAAAPPPPPRNARWLLPFWYEGAPPTGAASVLASDDGGATWHPHGFIHGSPKDGPENSTCHGLSAFVFFVFFGFFLVFSFLNYIDCGAMCSSGCGVLAFCQLVFSFLNYICPLFLFQRHQTYRKLGCPVAVRKRRPSNIQSRQRHVIWVHECRRWRG